MNDPANQEDMNRQCQRLQQQVERDGGTQNLSQTDLAFYESWCGQAQHALPDAPTAALDAPQGVDESGGDDTGTIYGDPYAGTPDDPDDANPASPDPAIVRK